MREKKFKGYSEEIKKWIYGFHTKHWSTDIHEFDMDVDEIISINNNTHYTVAKDSVGQFTGFKDKNGVEIYEGDIVKYETYDEMDTYINRAEVYFDTELGAWMAHEEEVSSDIRLSSMDSKVEVIGNTYEDKLKESK